MSATGILALGPSLLSRLQKDFPEQDEKMPVLFIGHGNPMNALYDNAFTRKLSEIGKTLPRPKAVLCVSAHWLTQGTWVAAAPKPETIHDFGGFPQALFDVQYPAAGSPELAETTAALLKDRGAHTETKWGLDHGAWTILKHIYPLADIPVYQLSLDWQKPAAWHFETAKALQDLRKRGVLIIGSGNIVHNLGNIAWEENAKPFDWAVEFDETCKSLISKRDFQSLIDYQKLGPAAHMSIPTNDHYLPLMYVLGLAGPKENLTFPYEEIQNGSISMRCVQAG